MIKATEAKYSASILPIYEGNPLVECQPRLYTYHPTAIQKSLEKGNPKLGSEATRRQKVQWLIDLSLNMFICSKRHIELQEFIDAVIRHGYLKRSPLTQEDLDFMQELRSRDAAEESRLQETSDRQVQGSKASASYPKDEDDDNAGDGIPQTYDDGYKFGVSVSLIGCSGAGKSRSVQKILSLYPKVIRHSRLRREPIWQIVHLTVECPQSGGIKAVCLAILAQIDSILIDLKLIKPNRGYASLLRDQPAYKLQAEAGRLLALYSVGLLVIDEIQNIKTNGTEKQMLMNFFTSLSNTLCVPMLFIGTQADLSLLASEVRTARRFGSTAFIYWDRFKQDSTLWKNFISRLSSFNVLDGTGPLSRESQDAMYACTQGITDLIIKLFILSQVRALVCNCKELTPEIIRKTYDEYFKNVHPLIKALQEDDAQTIAAYKDLGISNEEFKLMTTKLADEAYTTGFVSEAELAKEALRRQIVDAVKSLNDGRCSDTAQNIIDMVMHNDYITPATIRQTADKVIRMSKIMESNANVPQVHDEALEPKLDPARLAGG